VRPPAAHVEGALGEILVPRAVSGVPGLSLCLAGWVVLAQGLRARGDERVVWLGAESARLAELYG